MYLSVTTIVLGELVFRALDTAVPLRLAEHLSQAKGPEWTRRAEGIR
jgi:hypothetical protein